MYAREVSQAPVIRRATRTDRAVVLHFHRDLYIKFRDQIAAPSVLPLFAYEDLERTLRDDVDGLLNGPGAVVFLAELAGEAVGYVSGHVDVDPRRVLAKKGVIEDWFVNGSARGQGVGKLLMDTLVAYFRDAQCEVVESGTWAFNDHARKAHKKAGFAEIEVKFRKKL